MKRVFDFLTGENEYFEQKYFKLYGKNDYSAEIEKMKRKTMKKYICFAIVTAVALIVVFLAGQQGAGINTAGGNEISIPRPQEGEGPVKIPMKLDVLWDDDEKITRNVVILVRPEETEVEAGDGEPTEESALEGIETEVRKLIKLINRSSTGSSVALPAELNGGVRLIWNVSRNSNLQRLIPLFLIALLVIYRRRYLQIKSIESEARESIIRELPDFINKLMLLLNAGLVMTSAFDRILENYADNRKGAESYFYSQLLQVSRSKRETNSSMICGLKEFAGRSGVRELTRIANIIADNLDKGSELAYKLQGESELLWHTKKKLAEEKGRLAETKLTFPLVILLLVLITVTIAPALMEM